MKPKTGVSPLVLFNDTILPQWRAFIPRGMASARFKTASARSFVAGFSGAKRIAAIENIKSSSAHKMHSSLSPCLQNSMQQQHCCWRSVLLDCPSSSVSATGYAPFSACCPASDLPSLELCSVPLCTCTRSSVHPQYEVLAACERHCRGISAYRKHLEVHGPADSGPLEVQSRALCYWC